MVNEVELSYNSTSSGATKFIYSARKLIYVLLLEINGNTSKAIINKFIIILHLREKSFNARF